MSGIWPKRPHLSSIALIQHGLAKVQDDKPARIPISALVWQGIDAVRLSRLTNMLDRPVVARLAGELGYPDTTLLLGHTRWRTRGDEQVNSNNHPIRAGEVIATHNGTIYNADYLFRRWKLRRFAEVDNLISDFGLEIAD